MKILYTGDPHFSNVQIATRNDSFEDTCLDKLQQVISLAQEKEADIIVFPGDVFGTPLTSKIFLARCMRIMKSSRVPIYTIVGNHSGDSSYKQFDSYINKDLGIMISSGAMRLLDFISIQDQKILGLSAYQYRTDDEYENISSEKKEATIIVCHHFLHSAFSGDELFISPEKIKYLFPKVKWVIGGHDHTYHGIEHFGSFVYLNVGSLLRTTSGEENNRVPKVGLIDTEKQTVDEYPLRSAEFSSLFSLEVKAIEKEADKQLGKFEESIQETGKINAAIVKDVQDYVDKITDVNFQNVIKSELQLLGILG